MGIEFDFLFHGRSGSTLACSIGGLEENFFRIGASGYFSDHCTALGSAYPSFSLAPDCTAEILQIGFTTATKCPDIMQLTDYGNNGTLSRTESHHIKITLNNTATTVQISGGGQPDYIASKARTETDASLLGDSVPIWFMSNRRNHDYNLGNATLSNI